MRGERGEFFYSFFILFFQELLRAADLLLLLLLLRHLGRLAAYLDGTGERTVNLSHVGLSSDSDGTKIPAGDTSFRWIYF